MKRKLPIILLIAVFGLLAWIRPVSAQTNTNPVTLTVEPGFATYFRSDRLVPLLVTATNKGPDVSGELHVESSAGKYSTPIDLPNGSSKRVFLYVTLPMYSSAVQVDLSGDSGLIASISGKVQYAASTELIYAVITDQSQSAQLKVDFKQNRTSNAHQVNWRLDNIPESADALRALDVMVFSSIDTGQLNAHQTQAIADWVRDGGHLVVTGGPAWQKTAADFADLLPLKPDSVTTLASLGSLADFAGSTGDSMTAPNGSEIKVATGTLTADANVLVQESNTPLLVRRPYGDGFVDYLSVDPALEPYQSWAHADQFWFSLLSTAGIKPTWTAGIVDDSQAANLANYIKGLRLPDVAQLCGFLGIYIILIGPLNYLVLKRLGRREFAWLTIPLIIIGYSILAYATGFSLRGAQATLNRVALVRVWPNDNIARIDGVVGILSPRRATYDLISHDGLTLRSINPDNSGGYTSTAPLDVTIEEKPGATLDYTVKSVSVNAGLVAGFSAAGYTTVKPMTGSATILLADGKVAPSSSAPQQSIAIDVKNTTDLTLENAVVLYPGGHKEIGTFAAGDSQSLTDQNFAPGSQPSPLWSGNGLSNNNNNYNSNYYNGYNGYTNNCGYSDPNIPDIMGKACNQHYNNNYGYNGYGYNTSSPQEQEYVRRQLLLDSIIQSTDPNGGRGLNVYVVGWTRTSPLNVNLGDAQFTPEDTTIYIYQLPVTVKAINPDLVEIPSSLMTWIVNPNSSRTDVTPYSMQLNPGESAILRFTPLMPVKNIARLNVNLTSPNNSGYNLGVVSLWNWSANKWENVADLKFNKTLEFNNPIPQPQRFIGPGGAVEVQVKDNPINTTATPIPGITYDSISVTLYGQFDTPQ